MEKIHLICSAFFVILFTASAITVTVTSIADAQKELGKSSAIEEIGCKVYSIRKTAVTQKELTDLPWTVNFAVEYTVDGVPARGETKPVSIRENTEEAAAAATEPLCDIEWLAMQALHGTVDMVIVETLPEDNKILTKMYSMVEKKWKDLPVEEEQEIEEPEPIEP